MKNNKNNSNEYVSNLPRKIQRLVQFLFGLDTKESIILFKDIIYLYREYFITTDIRPIIKEFIVSFKFKDETLINVKVKSIRDIIKIIQEIKFNKGEDL